MFTSVKEFMRICSSSNTSEIGLGWQVGDFMVMDWRA